VCACYGYYVGKRKHSKDECDEPDAFRFTSAECYRSEAYIDQKCYQLGGQPMIGERIFIGVDCQVDSRTQ